MEVVHVVQDFASGIPIVFLVIKKFVLKMPKVLFFSDRHSSAKVYSKLFSYLNHLLYDILNMVNHNFLLYIFLFYF